MSEGKFPWAALYVELPPPPDGNGYGGGHRVRAKIRERRGKGRTYRQLQWWNGKTCVSFGLGSVPNAVLVPAIAGLAPKCTKKHRPTETTFRSSRTSSRSTSSSSRTKK